MSYLMSWHGSKCVTYVKIYDISIYIGGGGETGVSIQGFALAKQALSWVTFPILFFNFHKNFTSQVILPIPNL
jgi:hypothetical protein